MKQRPYISNLWSELTFKAILKAKRPKIHLLYKKRRVSPSSVNEFPCAKSGEYSYMNSYEMAEILNKGHRLQIQVQN